MKFLRVLVALAVSACLLPAADAAPLEAYGKLPSIEAVAISPTGQSLAMVVTDGEQRMVLVKDIATNRFTLRAPAGAAKIRRIQWADELHLLVVASATGASVDPYLITGRGEYLFGFVLDLQKRRLAPMMKGAGRDTMNTIVDMPVTRTVSGETAAYVQGVAFVGGAGRRSLFRIDLDTSTAKLVEIGASDTRDWTVGADGQPVAQELYDGRTGTWTLRVKHNGSWRDAETIIAPHDPPNVMGLGRDGRSVLYVVYDPAQGWSWREARTDGSLPDGPLSVKPGQSPILDPANGRVIGQYALVGDERRYTFFEEADNRSWNAVTSAFPNDQVTLASWSVDHQRIVALVDSPKEGPGYALVDLRSRNATWLGAQYEGLKGADISPWQSVRFTAADGLELTGYLTLPRGKEARNLPLVVFPHGGPAARDEPGFDWWAQGMASRGYAVLQVNFRGSEGLGTKLLEAGYGQWGRKMQTDLSDGVRHLANDGIIDPKRVCIVGASYGGYAALAGAAFDPGVYRCAASVAGPSDLRRMVIRSGDVGRRYWTRFMGAEDVRDPHLAEISPAAHVDQIRIPVLLIHGRDDTVVPLEQSRIMAEAMQKAGKPAELVVQTGADHWLSRGDTRLQTLQAVVTFLEKNNPPN